MAARSARPESADQSATSADRKLGSPLDGLLGYRLRRASITMMSDLVEALRPLGLSVGEASLLILVGANPGCRQSDVGRALEIKRANLTPLVSRMKARGLIADTPIDGRSLSLSLTATGLAKRDAALTLALASNRKFEQRLTFDEKTLMAALERLAG